LDTLNTARDAVYFGVEREFGTRGNCEKIDVRTGLERQTECELIECLTGRKLEQLRGVFRELDGGMQLRES
jgi:hypothetical protein